MPKPPDKGGGLKGGDQQPTHPPAQTTVDPAWAGRSVTGGITTQQTQPSTQQRPFAQIIADETATRNMIQLNLRRTQLDIKNLSFEDLGEVLFDILKINPEDCLALDFTTGRYDT